MNGLSSWYPLAVFDPVLGDPERVRAAGEEYARVATAIALAAEDLRTIASEMEGSSAAVDEVDAKAVRLAGTIERAHGRYAATGEALLTYAGALAHAQELARAAHTTAVTAVQAQDEALASIARWTRFADGTSDPAVRAQYLRLADDARADLARTDVQLERARVELQHAVVHRDGAASAASAAIRGAMGRDDLHDTVWQDIGGGAQEVGLHVWNGVDEVAAALGIAAVVLCWVPGVNVVVAAGATIAGVLLLFRDSVNLATGNGSGKDVRASALGVVTFGVGRFAQKGIELSVAAARGARGLRVDGVARAGGAAAAQSTQHAARGSTQAGVLAGSSARDQHTAVMRSGELWRAMSPAAIARDTWADLRSGVELVRAPGLYRPSARGHVPRPVDAVATPVREYRVHVGATWNTSKAAGVFSAVGNDAAARAVAPSPHVGPRYGWAALSGGVQVVETSCALSAVPALRSEVGDAVCTLSAVDERRGG